MASEMKAVAIEQKRKDLELEMKLAFQREQAEHEREERERERQFELQKFELELAAKCTQPSPSLAPSFDITKHVRLVPPISEREVDRYFPYFERVATTLKWPKETWTLLLQSVLVGRARDAYVSLPIEPSLSCCVDTVKREILHRYELAPEAYRQRFRHCKKTDRHMYVEFAHEKKISLVVGVPHRQCRRPPNAPHALRVGHQLL